MHTDVRDRLAGNCGLAGPEWKLAAGLPVVRVVVPGAGVIRRLELHVTMRVLSGRRMIRQLQRVVDVPVFQVLVAVLVRVVVTVHVGVLMRVHDVTVPMLMGVGVGMLVRVDVDMRVAVRLVVVMILRHPGILPLRPCSSARLVKILQ